MSSYVDSRAALRRRQKDREDLRKARQNDLQIKQRQRQKEQDKKDERSKRLKDIMYSQGKVNTEALAEFRAFYMREVGSNKKLSNVRVEMLEKLTDFRESFEDENETFDETKAQVAIKLSELKDFEDQMQDLIEKYDIKFEEAQTRKEKAQDLTNDEERVKEKIKIIENNEELLQNLIEEVEKAKLQGQESLRKNSTMSPPPDTTSRRRSNLTAEDLRIKKYRSMELQVEKYERTLEIETKNLEKIEPQVAALECEVAQKKAQDEESTELLSSMRKEIRDQDKVNIELLDEISKVTSENERIKRRIDRSRRRY